MQCTGFINSLIDFSYHTHMSTTVEDSFASNSIIIILLYLIINMDWLYV